MNCLCATCELNEEKEVMKCGGVSNTGSAMKKLPSVELTTPNAQIVCHSTLR